MDLVSWTFASETANVDRPVLIDPSNPSRRLSIRQLRSKVRQLVAGLQAAGVQKGDCICVNSFNDILYSVLFLGIIGSGCIFTGVNPAYTVNELNHHLQLTKPKIIIVEPHLLKNTLVAAEEAGIPKSSIFAFDIHSANQGDGIRSWNDLLQHGEADWVKVADPSKTVSQYATTSGTSGLPKAALISHSYHVSQAAHRLTDDTLPYTVRRLTPLPPFHAFATPIVPASIKQGVPVYVMRRFEMISFIKAIHDFEISETYMAPPVVIGMPQSPHCTKEALKSLRQIWFGGASLKYANQVPLYALLQPSAKIQPVWGMTEAGWITAGKWPEMHNDDSVGHPLPGYEVKVVDDDDKVITDEGSFGDICVKCDSLMLGYLDNEKATRETLDGSGWLRTGDVGQFVNGKVFLVDRKKDLIKVRGWQVSPAEVESAVLEHPDVDDAAVVGVTLDDGISEIPRAYVVLREGSEASEEDIKAFACKLLARYKIPEQVVFVDSIPKNPTGKILRRLLRTKEADKTEVVGSAIHQRPSSGSQRLLKILSWKASLASKSMSRFFTWLRRVLLQL